MSARRKNTAQTPAATKPKRQDKSDASSSPNLETNQPPHLAESFEEAVQELAKGLSIIPKPHHKKLRENILLAQRMIRGIQKYARGEITYAQFGDLESEIPKRFRVSPAPPWLPDSLTRLLLCRSVTERMQLAKWLVKLDEKPIGRPIASENYVLGQEAARLKQQQKLSWGQIARRLCPERKSYGHQCSKKCEDRIRQLAKPFLD